MNLPFDTTGMSKRCKIALGDVIATNQLKSTVQDMASDVNQLLISPIGDSYTVEERSTIVSSINTMLKNIQPVLDRKFMNAGMVLDDCIKREVAKQKRSGATAMVSRVKSSPVAISRTRRSLRS